MKGIKLTLSKKTIANLNNLEMDDLNGGMVSLGSCTDCTLPVPGCEDNSIPILNCFTKTCGAPCTAGILCPY